MSDQLRAPPRPRAVRIIVGAVCPSAIGVVVAPVLADDSSETGDRVGTIVVRAGRVIDAVAATARDAPLKRFRSRCTRA
jgi:hypothetical protein